MQVNSGNNGTAKPVAPTKMSATKHVEKRAEKTFTPFPQKYAGTRSSMSSQNIIIDVSDASVWKTAHMLMRHFPGTVREIRE